MANAAAAAISKHHRVAVSCMVREVPLAPWSWPAEGVRFLVAPGMLGNVWRDGDDAWLQVGAKTPLPLAHFRQFNVEWDVIDA